MVAGRIEAAIISGQLKPGALRKCFRNIVEALERRDPVVAEAAMREHLRHAGRYIEEQIAAQGEC